MGLINLLEPLRSLDHVGPKLIVEEEIWIDISPPSIMDDGLIIRLPRLLDTMEGVLGNLQSLSAFHQKEQRGRLPHKAKGSVQNLTMGYEPSHPIDRWFPGANLWLAESLDDDHHC